MEKSKDKNFCNQSKQNESQASSYEYEELAKILSIPKVYEKDFKTLDKQNLAKKYRSICLLGVTGSGKSSTATNLSGDLKSFKVSGGSQSETSEVTGVVTNFLGEKDEPVFIITDTPGIGDSNGRDTQHIAKMVFSLKRIGYVHSFLIVINSEDVRMNEQLQQTLQLFSQMFGNEFFENAIICFSKFRYDKRAIKERLKEQRSEESLKNEMTKRFKADFNFNLQPNQFVFLDNAVNPEEQEDFDELEIEMFYSAFDHIKNFSLQVKPFECQSIQEVMKQNDRIKKNLQDLQDKYESEKQQYAQKIQKIEEQRKKAEQDTALALQKAENEKKLKIEAETRAQNEKIAKEEARKKQKQLEDELESQKQLQARLIREKEEEKKKAQKEQDLLRERLNNQPSPYVSGYGGGFGGSGGFYIPSKPVTYIESPCNFSTSSSTCSGPLTSKGKPDMRYNANRNIGTNVSGQPDRRFNKNK